MAKTPGRWTVADLAIIALAGLVGALLTTVVGWDDRVSLILLLQFLFSGAAIFMVGRMRRRDFRRLGFEVQAKDGWMVLWGVGIQLALALLFLPVATLVGLESEPQSLSTAIEDATGTWEPLALFLLVGLVGPVLEELMFRGILIDILVARFRARGVVFGSAAVFGAFHLLGISAVQPLQSAVVVVPQVFLFGVALAYFRIMRERLGPAILCHAGFNLVSLAVLFL